MAGEKVFDSPLWMCYKYDGRRKKFFCGLTRKEFDKAKEIHDDREWNNHRSLPKTRTQEVNEILKYFSEIPYEYEGDGLDDFNKFQRPSYGCQVYEAICPGEPMNNFYTNNPAAVAILKRRYYKWKESNL